MKNKNKNNKKQKLITIVLAVILILLIIWAVNVYRESSKEEKVQESQQEITFPYELEDGKLEIESLFQFSGTNPDCEDKDGENIAALNIINRSEQYLSSAEIRINLADGTKLVFKVTDMPAGQSAMIFEKNNKSYDLSENCTSIEDTAEYEETTALMEDKLTIDVQDTTITLTNISDEDLTNLLLHCHCLFDEAYFGGLTYTYPVDSIPVGESVSLQADECYLGEAAVVRISQDE